MPDTSPLQNLSTGIAQVYKDRYGRGPTKVTAHYAGDAVLCVLEQVNTTGLTALVQLGRSDIAQAAHLALQLGMADDMTAVVERETGRTVRAYIPGFNADLGMTTDTFVLEPAHA